MKRGKNNKLLSKPGLIKVLMTSAEVTRATAERVLDDLVESIITAVRNGGSVRLKGFGVFVQHESPARIARNPKTGAPANVAVRKSMKFRATKGLRNIK